MNTKNILFSKTLWLNLIAVIVAFIWKGTDTQIMSSIADTTTVWLPILNVVNRFLTNQGVTLN